MTDFFDSPLFWIVVIWWLLSTFLGAKARKRRAMQRLVAQESEPPVAAGTDEFQYELEAEEEEDAARPVGIEPEEEIPEPVAEPVAPTSVFGDQVKPGPPRRTPLPKPPLEQLVRSLGIPKEFIPSGILREDEEPIPEVETPVPESEPAEKPVRYKPPTSVVPVPRSGKESPATAEIASGISRLDESLFPSLTPLQQAIVLKEVLDRPRALRRGIR